jgi:hypothetical protein
MTTLRNLAVASALALTLLAASDAGAAVIRGKATFVGTFSEEVSGGTYSARARVRTFGTCDNDNTPKERWVLIRSGRMDGVYVHNSVNMRNIYSTLTAALLSGKSIEIFGVSGCNPSVELTADAFTALVGIF